MKIVRKGNHYRKMSFFDYFKEYIVEIIVVIAFIVLYVIASYCLKTM